MMRLHSSQKAEFEAGFIGPVSESKGEVVYHGPRPMKCDNPRMSQLHHRYQDLIALFNQCFEQEYRTRLVKGGDEPIYLPLAEDRSFNELHFAHGFFASALHETAHWLIAGEQRRKLVDFGYWYKPDGRTASEQSRFEQVEVKPQALEWILAQAAGFQFRVSADNLSGEPQDNAPFKRAVWLQVQRYVESGLPPRAVQFRQALCAFYGVDPELRWELFDFESL